MMYVKHKLEIDLAGQAVMPRVDMVEGDQYARQLELSLTSGGESWEIPEDVHASVRYRKPDGTNGEYDALPDGSLAWSASGNVLTVALAPQVLSCPGNGILSVVLTQGDARVSTFHILFQVHGAIPGGLESEDYFCYDGLLPAPKNAEIGQFLKVSGVNGHGVASQVETVTLPPLDEAVDTALAQAKESGEFDGASAYQIARNNGYTGTEAEWLESLKGKFDPNVGNIRLINITGKLTSEPGAILDFHTSRLRGVQHPQDDNDAATRLYVDQAAAGYAVPSYWQEAVDAAASKITAKQDVGGVDCMTFALLSDIHAVPGSTTPNSGHTGNLAAAVMDACAVPFAVCCGDVCRTDADSETAARESMAAGMKNLRPIGARKLLQALGDHDGSYGTAQLNAGALFGGFFRSQAEDERRRFGGDGSYFYVDYPAAKIRLIVLNSCWTDSSHLRTANFGYGNTQLNWLADTALSFTEDGWCVALFAHVPPVAAYSAQIRDMTVLRGILAAFLNKTSYTGTSGTSGAWDYVSVSCNFTGKHNGKIVGFFCGHSHGDSIVTDETPYPIVTITSDAHSLAADSGVTRTVKTVTEHAIDFVTVNRSAKTVSLTRLGAGADRSYSYQ